MITRRRLVTALSGSLAAVAGQEAAEPAVIPRPARLLRRSGEFLLEPATRVVAGAGARDEAEWLAGVLGCRTSDQARRRGSVELRLEPSLAHLGPEGYMLEVTPQRVTIRGSAAAGVFRGAQSLRQLLPPAAFSAAGGAGSRWRVPCLEIGDSPRFPWRGGLMDVARHFQPKAAILKYIDALALHKINTLQLHLTDDQGWRIEIKKYPKLTEVGSVRRETRAGHEREGRGFDGKPHGGYYTQADIREIVAYAGKRHITVVPEIEMPGHAQAALAAYPEFGNTGEKLEVWTRWGVSRNVFRVSEKTFGFLEDVLSEVLELFPSRYIHVGGDEVPPDQWKASPEAQARIRELGLTSETELHTWFIGRINRFLSARGRTLVGWDEIIEGGMTPGAVVMSWRGVKGGIEAARQGHNVVMTPTSHTYFDYYQSKDPREPLAIGGLITLEQVYDYEPVPAEVSPEEAPRVLGTQGQLWSEYLPTPEHMQYMAFPRMCALSEVAWTPAERRDYADFLRRLPIHLERLKAMGINFRPLDVAPF
jgi:hexosaminidase